MVAMTVNSTTLYIIVALVALIIIVALVFAARRAKSARLEKRFGPEYHRTIRETGDRAAAERQLEQREARVRKFHIAELPAGARERYAEEWRTVQSRFVDRPEGALGDADRLVTNVMRDRGYPIGEFDQRVADISADHPNVTQHYRAAHDIAVRTERGEVSTEDLRQAMVHYRALFNDLLGTTERKNT